MKRTKKSQKKTKFLLILMVLTAILSITATYAWFSSQRDVEIVGMKLNVEVAESMQISLDGEHWVQSITIDNMRQFYGTYSDTTKHQAKAGDNTNYVPTELLPVSTIGEVSAGKIQFMQGQAVMGATSTSVEATACNETTLTADATVDSKQGGNAAHPYLVFAMYLRNLSKKTADNLVLNKASRVWVDDDTASSQEGTGVEGTGLENCARVGFVVYENTADITAAGEDIRDLASSTVTSAAIWEPNDLAHTADAIANSKRTVADGTTLPTYGVKYAASGVTVSDIESTTDSALAEQVTMKPTYDATGTTAEIQLTDTAGTGITIPGNKVSKVRVYIWLEGQDVDCINSASYGDRLQATIKLTKPVNNEGTSNSYTGDGSGS